MAPCILIAALTLHFLQDTLIYNAFMTITAVRVIKTSNSFETVEKKKIGKKCGIGLAYIGSLLSSSFYLSFQMFP